jgi:protein-disulfide isomerase
MMMKKWHLLALVLVLLLADGLKTTQAQEVPQAAREAILNSPGAASFGDGTTVVEFFDYQCHYCKGDEAILQRLVQEGSIRIVYVDFPKLGPQSTAAALAAVAILRQDPDKYFRFRQIMMSPDVAPSDQAI